MALRRTLRGLSAPDGLTRRATVDVVRVLPAVLRQRRVIDPEIEGWVQLLEQPV